ncbi:protein fem-1 homolog C [Hyalella azteca]|uniref:Protein fem-1 homolog C n=1 Tax=Hyalella azteca TaxID=294128 RepID=A0A8B7P953_HYAAZ|nr:protein fem-1 homolog C [Hyalella azteca]
MDMSGDSFFNPSSLLWPSPRDDEVAKLRRLFFELVQQIKEMGPDQGLSHLLRRRIESFSKQSRQEFVNWKSSGCTPLFLACQRGLAEVVEYLCSTCGADIELKGIYEVPEDRSNHFVTPLWCAAVAGQLEVVKMLISKGAYINSESDTGSTSVRSACYMSHISVVKFLVESGADVQKSNFNGGTCLINSVQNVELCKILLDHGANINAKDIKSKTALHYAIEEHRLETVKLLIKRGADPFIKSCFNDDAVQIACIKGALPIFMYLITELELPIERIADCHEVLGSTYLDERNNVQEAINHWRISAQIREEAGIAKKISPPHMDFNYVAEFVSQADLDSIILDQDSLRMQSLLICLRVLGGAHKDTIYRLMIRGAAYADTLQYQRCIQLWLHALNIRIINDTMLNTEVNLSSNALMKLMLDIIEAYPPAEVKRVIVFEDVFRALTLIGDQFEQCTELLSIKPEFRRQQCDFDQSLTLFIYLIFVNLLIEPNKDQMQKLVHYITKIVRLNPVTTDNQFSLLHLSATNGKLTFMSGSAPNQFTSSHFPDPAVTSLLLDCDANVNARSRDGCSPLFLASHERHYKKEIFKILLERGAHLDQANFWGDHAGVVLRGNRAWLIDPLALPVPPLKCLAARTMRRHRVPVLPGDLPSSLAAFLAIH